MINSFVELTKLIRDANHERPISDYSTFDRAFQEAATAELSRYYKMGNFNFVNAINGRAIFSCSLSGHSCFPEMCSVTLYYLFDYEKGVALIGIKIFENDIEIGRAMSTPIEEDIARTDELYHVRFINNNVIQASEDAKRRLRKIPFDKLLDTIGTSQSQYDDFMNKEFTVTVYEGLESAKVYKTLNVTRGHFEFSGDTSYGTSIISDTGMRYLADLIGRNLTRYHEDNPNKTIDDYSIYDFGVMILSEKFGIHPDDDELDQQDIEPGTLCYDRDNRRYVYFLQKVNKDVMEDCKNAYVQVLPPDSRLPKGKAIGPIEVIGLISLVPEY